MRRKQTSSIPSFRLLLCAINEAIPKRKLILQNIVHTSDGSHHTAKEKKGEYINMNNDNCQRAESTHSLDSCAENRASWHSLADRAFDLNRLPRAASDLMNTRMHSMLSRIHIFQHCRHVGLLRTCDERAAVTLFIAPYVNRKMEICLRSYFSILKYAGSTQSVVLFVFLFLNSVTRSIGANNSTYSH